MKATTYLGDKAMPIVPAKCTSCGASLEVDNVKDAAICPYCGTAFVVEKAIHNYNIINNNQITASVVNVYNSANNDFEIVAGRLIRYCGASADAIVPSGVSVISKSAFEGLDCLKSVTIPEGVRLIESNVFAYCENLISIHIPDSVKTIEIGTFKKCKSLAQVVYSYIDENAMAFRGTPFYKGKFGIDWECQFCGKINPGTNEFCSECGIANILELGEDE